MKDYYKILAIDRNASQDDIKQRFRELAFENHPDVSSRKDATGIFIEIYEAYQILGNSETKEKYDLLYDKLIGNARIEIPDEETLKSNIWSASGSAGEAARQKAKIRYRDFIKDQDCFFTDGLKADGKPYYYNMHKNVGISGGTGPMGSIKSRTVNIPVPRSKKALLMHRAGFLIKALFFVLSLFVLKPGLFPEQQLTTKIVISASLILAGGIFTQLVYQLNKTRSKFFFASGYILVKKYKKNGYKRGFHPMMSTTPAGIIAWIVRLLF